MAPDHYQLLGVARAASREEITQAWRRRARAEHPDRRPPEAGDAAAGRFRDLAEAYHVLSDPDRRAAYDSTLSPTARTWARPAPVFMAEPPLRAGPVRVDGAPVAQASRGGDKRDIELAILAELAVHWLARDRGWPW
jgi:curved DNA-binding protein CbpA